MKAKAAIKDRYISDIFDELPYGVLSKGETNCGATTIPLENNKDVIICVPLINLIKNKVAQYPNNRCNYSLQGVYYGITEDEIREYLEIEQPKKFIVTYDSFLRLKSIIGDISNYHIVIDEFSDIILPKIRTRS